MRALIQILPPEHMGKQVRCQNCQEIFTATTVTSSGPPPILPLGSGTRVAHEIDYEIFGDDMQYVEVTLDPREAVIAEAGAMMYMTSAFKWRRSSAIRTSTVQVFGTRAVSRKRVLTGESLFMTIFSNVAGKRETVAFGAPYPGRIEALHLTSWAARIVFSAMRFCAEPKGIEISIAFQKKIGVGFARRRTLYAKADRRWHRPDPRLRYDDASGT